MVLNWHYVTMCNELKERLGLCEIKKGCLNMYSMTVGIYTTVKLLVVMLYACTFYFTICVQA